MGLGKQMHRDVATSARVFLPGGEAEATEPLQSLPSGGEAGQPHGLSWHRCSFEKCFLLGLDRCGRVQTPCGHDVVGRVLW